MGCSVYMYTINRRSPISIICLMCLIHASAWGADWQIANPGLPGVYGNINALVNDSAGRLYAGGGFTIAGDKTAANIARWDPSANSGAGGWTALGSGVDAEVYALAIDKSGNVYAGGYFTSAGGAAANHIAKWNPSTQKWSALGSGTSNGVGGLVKAIACDASGNVYVGGSFTTAGTATANYIAKWNGSSWSALGTGSGNGLNLDANTLAFDASGVLYVGGWFDVAGGKSASYLATWNPAANNGAGAWSALGQQVNNTVTALAFDPSGQLYAGGSFTSAGSKDAYYVAKWNPSTQQWAALGNGYGVYSSVAALACDKSGKLYMGGYFSSVGAVTNARYIAKWDPAANSGSGDWLSLNAGMDAVVNAISIDASGNLYAGGNFRNADGKAAEKIAKWAGGQWSTLGSGMNDAVHALAFDTGGNLYAGGKFWSVGGVAAGRIAKCNASTGQWSALGSGITRSDTYSPFVETMAFDASGNLYVGGYFTHAGGVAAANIAKWNGTAWSALGAGVDGRVDAIAFDAAGNVYVGGAFDNAGGAAAHYVAKWNGTSWSALGSGATRSGGWGAVYALACGSSGVLYAGGRFDSAGGAANTNGLAKWNGSSWSAVGSGLTGSDPWISALIFDKSGNLYAGGKFDTIGGVSTRGPAKWNPSAGGGAGAWSMLGGGVSGDYPYIEALAIDGSNNLYVGGRFSSYYTGSFPTNACRIARLSLTSLQWSTLGAGVDSGNSRYDIQAVLALACDSRGNVHVGGDFTMAGTRMSPYYTQWGMPPVKNAASPDWTFYRD